MLQDNGGAGQALEQLRAATPQNPLASPFKRHPKTHCGVSQALLGPASAMLSRPGTVPPETRQQAVQKLRLPYLHQQQQQQQQQGVEQGELGPPGLSHDLQPGWVTPRPPEELPLGAPLASQQPSPESDLSRDHPLQYSSPDRDSQLEWSASGAAAELGSAQQQGLMSPGSNSAADLDLLDSPAPLAAHPPEQAAALPSMAHSVAGRPTGVLRNPSPYSSLRQRPGPPLHQDPSTLDLLRSGPHWRGNISFFEPNTPGPYRAPLRPACSGSQPQQQLHGKQSSQLAKATLVAAFCIFRCLMPILHR